MIHVLEIGLALSLVVAVAGLVSLTPRAKPVPVRIRANRSHRHPGN
ncbi:hypothetical protein [Brevundimonas sp.]